MQLVKAFQARLVAKCSTQIEGVDYEKVATTTRKKASLNAQKCQQKPHKESANYLEMLKVIVDRVVGRNSSEDNLRMPKVGVTTKLSY